MCGIAGFIDFRRATGRDAGEGALRRMADRLAHRGPDDHGLWSDPEHGVFLAHRRLSIVDLSSAGHQPMRSASGRYVVVYNGEIYNHRSLRAELEALAPRAWRGHSDTEVMLEAFEAWGVEAALRKMVGMFAIALWDRLERTLTLVRDRAGEKPLYWGLVDGKLAFGSELKALEGLHGGALPVNPDALPLLLRYSYIPAPASIYAGVHKLMPGSWVRFAGQPQPAAQGVYWSAAQSLSEGLASPLKLSAGEAVDELERLATDAVRLQLEADVPVGAFLSGGIDSSTVVALAQRCTSQPVRTFSIGFQESAFDEARFAKRVAEHLGTAHTELHVSSQDALDCVPTMASVYDEPFADSSQIPTYLVARLARQSVTVSLSGDGGDELFCGYPRYGRAEVLRRLLATVPAAPRRAVAALIESMSPQALNRLAAAFGRAPASDVHRTHGDRLHRMAQLMRLSPHLVYRHFSSSVPDAGRLSRRAEPATLFDRPGEWPEGADSRTLYMWLEFMTYLPDDMLAKVDRATMAVSLESRVPLLDHRVIEFAHRLPLDLKVRDGMGKWALRQVLYRHVPRELIDRPKMGFSLPMAAWLRGPLRDWAESLLGSPRLQGDWVDAGVLRQLWQEHQSGARDWQHAIWSVLMLLSWQEHRGVEGFSGAASMPAGAGAPGARVAALAP